MPGNVRQTRGLTAIDAITALIVIMLVVQIWLLSATLESFLAGYTSAALPGAIASGLLCAACFAGYRFIARIDREVRENTHSGGRSAQ
jgi:hypothetical protein